MRLISTSGVQAKHGKTSRITALALASILSTVGFIGLEGSPANATCGIVGGDGSDEENAYLISNRAELEAIPDCLTSNNYFALDSDINLTTPLDMIEVGDSIDPINLDGQNFEITGLEISESGESSVGLFDYFEGEIKNINISGPGITAFPSSSAYVGGIAGTLLEGETKVTNLSLSYDDISVSGDFSSLYAGGLFGLSNNEANLDATGVEVKITNEFYVKSSNSNSTLYVGGIMGLVVSGSFENVMVEADINVSETANRSRVGGAIAQTGSNMTGNVEFENFGYEGTASSNNYSQAGFFGSIFGGVVGLHQQPNTNSVKISESYVRVEASRFQVIGGAIGKIENGANNDVMPFTVENSNIRLKAILDGGSSFRAGGVVGYIEDTDGTVSDPEDVSIKKNYIEAVFEGSSTNMDISPLFVKSGSSSGALDADYFADNYFNNDIYQTSAADFEQIAIPSNLTTAGSKFTPLTSAEAIDQTSFSNFDFDKPVWKICDRDGGPHLATEPDRCTEPVSQTPPSSSAAPAPYTGPLVTSVGSQQSAGAFQTTSSATVTVYGERLSGVSKVFIDGKEAVISSTSNDSFVMTLPEGLTDGVHDLVIQSSLGNLTYLDGISIAGETVQITSYGQVSAWTSRISDTQLKVYVKYPTVGEKVRISHQTGGSGDYNTVYVKTTSSETMDGLRIVEGVGTYVVRTIDLEEINRIRVTVGDEQLVQVRYNN